MSSNGRQPDQIARFRIGSGSPRLHPRDRAAGPAARPVFGAGIGPMPEYLQRRPLWIVSASLIGLVLAVVLAGFVGLAFNQNVQDATDGALRYDIALQDDADDLRVAILEVRHFHRNLVFDGPSNENLIGFEDAHAQLLEEIDEIEAMGTLDPTLPQPDQLRRMTEEYYGVFSPAVGLRTSDPAAFGAASNDGLVRLGALERAARRIDRYAELQADLAVARIEQASSNARLVLLVVIGGLVLVGAVLIVTAVRVIGEIRRLYEAEQEASARLGEALQAKSDFVADASHELRTPLTVLRGNAEAGLAIGPVGPQREILEEIVDESAWMARLVEDLLFLARSDADAPPLDLAPIAVEPLLDEVAVRAEVLVRERGAVLATALTAGGTIVADGTRIEQAIMALVDNAAKFSPPGGRVRLAASNQQGELIVDVSDQGPGIPEAEMPLVFERFYRTDRARSRQRGGAGLGLPIAQTVVEAHGGRIEAHSRLGEGTRMRIYLPLAAPAPPVLPESIEDASPELAMGRAAS